MKLSSPWIIFYKELECLFDVDPEVNVVFDQEATEVKLFVDNGRKADALAKLLPTEKQFGNVTLKITVIPSNKTESNLQLFEDAFHNNPAFEYVTSSETPFGTMEYVVFARKVAQFFDDDISDLHGVRSTLYQNIAKDVFGEKFKINFCTDY